MFGVVRCCALGSSVGVVVWSIGVGGGRDGYVCAFWYVYLLLLEVDSALLLVIPELSSLPVPSLDPVDPLGRRIGVVLVPLEVRPCMFGILPLQTTALTVWLSVSLSCLVVWLTDEGRGEIALQRWASSMLRNLLNALYIIFGVTLLTDCRILWTSEHVAPLGMKNMIGPPSSRQLQKYDEQLAISMLVTKNSPARSLLDRLKT